MCGITGLWDRGGGPAERLASQVEAMASTLAHRGPDDAGVWTDAGAGIALGFRRLAIVDLTPTGHQPMSSRDARYTIVFNGEIFNYQDVRRELAGLGETFRGTSDTEVILAAVSRWGIEATLPRIWGMFAIALWDRDTRTLTLARDRLGKKPLYYAQPGARGGVGTAATGGDAGGSAAGAAHGAAGSSVWIFGSELKALRAHPGCPGEIDRDALAALLRYGYVPAPWTIYEGVAKLPPGSFLTIRDGDSIATARVQPYWSAREAAMAGSAQPLVVSDDEAIAQLDTLLRDAIRRRMIADVPLGAFLSGGIDSSTVVALMQAQSDRPVKTFTIGFTEEAYNEAPYAKQVAAHLGTEHHELYVSPDDVRAVIPRLPSLYDEPFADASQIPTFLISQLARQHVTVCLSGDGGDELFAGYTRHQWAERVWQGGQRVPAPLRRAAVQAMRAVRPATWDRAYRAVEPVLAQRFRQSHPGDKIHKLAEVLDASRTDAVYRRLVSQWTAPETVVCDAHERETWALQQAHGVAVPGFMGPGFTGPGATALGFTERMLLLDLVGYLPDDILTKLDRASMGVSLEARAPLLDHRVVEWAWRLPLSMKLRHGKGKWILREVLARYVPRELVERPKMGFGLPIGDWLRGPLRAWADALLDEQTLKQDGYFDPAPIREVWQTHLRGDRNEQDRLWPVLMFQSWLHTR
jgi:asparagine synthase (glutamine-hydrolysing)